MPKLKVVTRHEEQYGYRGCNVQLPTATAEALIAIAKAEDRTVSNVIRVLIHEALAARAATQSPQ